MGGRVNHTSSLRSFGGDFRASPPMIRGERATQILDHYLVAPALARFVLNSFEFVSLSQFGGESHELHAGIALFEPGKDDAGIESAAIGQDDFLWICSRGHDCSENSG